MVFDPSALPPHLREIEQMPEVKMVDHTHSVIKRTVGPIVNLALSDMPEKTDCVKKIVTDHVGGRKHKSNIHLWDALSKELPSNVVNDLMFSLIEGGIIRVLTH